MNNNHYEESPKVLSEGYQGYIPNTNQPYNTSPNDIEININMNKRPPDPQKLIEMQEIAMHTENNPFLEDPNKPIIARPLVQQAVLTKETKADANKKKDQHVAYQTEDHLISLQELAAKYGTSLNFESIANSKGLSTEKADELLKIHGKNLLSPPKQKSELEKFCSHILNFLNLLLIGAGALSFVSYGVQPDNALNLYLGIFLECLVIFDLVIEYMQERSTSDVMSQFKKMLPPTCTVIRDGKEDQKKAELLVLGDLVKIDGGKRIPADIRIILSRGLKVEQSALNGEADEVEIFAESLGPDVMDSKNLIFNGCQAIEGSAIGVVVKTGDNTFLGLVARQTTQTKGEETKFQREIKIFVQFIFLIGIIMGVVVFVIGLARQVRPDNPRNRDIIINMFINGFIVMIIANVPEGLPATVTTCLTIIAKKLAKRKVFIKKLECVEALGSATCIASDKTGTLTMNKMSLEHVWFDGHIYTSGYMRDNRKDFKGNPTWKTLFKVACLCNRAFFKEPDEEKEARMKAEKNPEDAEKLIDNQQDGLARQALKPQKQSGTSDMQKFRQSSRNLIAEYKKASGSFRADVEIIGETVKGIPNSQAILAQIKEVDIEEQNRLLKEINKRKKWQVIGDASETAIVRFCEDFKNTDNYKAKYEKIFEVPFNSKNKYQISIHEIYEKRFLVMKGAPDILIKRCSHYMKHGNPKPMDDKFKEAFNKTYEVLGSKGERVLAAAYYDLGNDKTNYSISLKNYKDEGLVFVGCFALMDPPKPGVEEAITAARAAHIRIMMVTGDHPLTAEAIARKVGIIRHYQTDKEIALKRNIPIDAVDPLDCLAKVMNSNRFYIYIY